METLFLDGTLKSFKGRSKPANKFIFHRKGNVILGLAQLIPAIKNIFDRKVLIMLLDRFRKQSTASL